MGLRGLGSACSDGGGDGGAEHQQAWRFHGTDGAAEAGPVGVARPVEVTLRMGHEAEDAAGGVADAGDGILGTVDVVGVADGDLAAVLEPGEDIGAGGDEAALTVGDGELEDIGAFIGGERLGQALGPDADGGGVVADGQPGIDEPAADVVLERDFLSRGLGGPVAALSAGKEAGLDDDLETVAGGDHDAAAAGGGAELGPEVLLEADGEDAAGGDVIAVGEAAGEAEELEAVEEGGLGDELVEVDELDGGTGEFEGAAHLSIAVGAGGADDQGAGLGAVAGGGGAGGACGGGGAHAAG